MPSSRPRTRRTNLVLEYHYDDGDVGAYPVTDLEQIQWPGPSSRRLTHILLRRDTVKGQRLSNRLLLAAGAMRTTRRSRSRPRRASTAR